MRKRKVEGSQQEKSEGAEPSEWKVSTCRISEKVSERISRKRKRENEREDVRDLFTRVNESECGSVRGIVHESG